MKTLLLSDIHANITALDAVLADAKSFDAVWCLGDVTGYGPDPNECVSRLYQLPSLTCLCGNHDTASLRRIDVADFNDDAQTTILWTRKTLSEENFAHLANHPEKQITDNFTLVHASPRHPVWEYVLDIPTARANFKHFITDFCLIGHTHLPTIFSQRKGNHHLKLEVPQINKKISLNGRAIINPGSVGQPRDYDPRASYAILNSEDFTIEYFRVKYDIQAVQIRMLDLDLPRRHIYRLSAGY